MISLKMALFIVAAFAAGSFFAPPVQQAIAAIIATDVQCTGCVGTTDLAGNSVTAAKIKDSEVKAAEIATDSVGAAELQGVTKLLFGQCIPTNTLRTTPINGGNFIAVQCNIIGIDDDDSASATLNDSSSTCFEVRGANLASGYVRVVVVNECGFSVALGEGSSIALIVYDK
jgi:hypothetical protein